MCQARLLLSQTIPIAQSYLKGKVIEISEDMQTSPVPGSYKREIGGEFADWDPGKSYFENLISQANVLGASQRRVYNPDTQEYTEIEIDEGYSGKMTLSINSIGIKN